MPKQEDINMEMNIFLKKNKILLKDSNRRV